MPDRIVGSLQGQATVAERVESRAAPDWVAAHWNTFRDGLLGERNDTPFPCFFGAESVANGDPLYTAVPSMTDKDALLDLGRTLRSYLDVHQEYSDRASLVAFFKPPERELSEAEYHRALWHILQFLHVHDPEPWPEDIPTDSDDPYWEFFSVVNRYSRPAEPHFTTLGKAATALLVSKSRSNHEHCLRNLGSLPTLLQESTPENSYRIA